MRDSPTHRREEYIPLAVIFLLQRGADRNIKDHQGKTPRILAVETLR